ncbi:Holliday junction resolvase RecU [Lysinibacillus fusiformis]|uniref:Holliday junction resolvase RecU n=1 Tax=Lysinibacillus fusiformis TaxID=28031 RepID=UPI000469BBBA|nr:Holliday junction resolvase RecU [Lysinibacillus fusiformis]
MRTRKRQYSRSHANRGKRFESLIDGTNNQYRNNNFADVRKVPPPLTILEVNGNQVDAKLEKATWVDYSGIYKGQSILLVCFWIKNKNEPEIYYLKFEQLEAAWIGQSNGGGKSIPLQFFRDHCVRIKSGIYTVHYLEAVGGAL